MKKLLFLKDVEMFNKIFKKGEYLNIVDKHAIINKVEGIIVYKIVEGIIVYKIVEAIQCEHFISNNMLKSLLDNKLAIIE
ncbi:hypothetical protein G8S21_10330 [Clostridium botulinum C]|uniref:hypothetical protein n=1 Tax=Clostridium botulinum TaxID=1491 RepID=UPI001E3B9029|nr:hypothetical protein [Clostridium botulinum]MCD3246333.1 hypothetical protein [Clostridium botulinum C]MCD3262696.1 hypothetical protein [Clostridium botulinum C]